MELLIMPSQLEPKARVGGDTFEGPYILASSLVIDGNVSAWDLKPLFLNHVTRVGCQLYLEPETNDNVGTYFF